MVAASETDLSLSREHIAEVTEGEIAAAGGHPIRVTNVQIDSRKCGPGSLFVALPGERSDGHAFISDAIERGASLCIVHRDFAFESKALIQKLAKDFSASLIAVSNPLHALQSLARDHMDRMQSVTCIAITGSNGKTTTKEMLGAMVSKSRKTAISPGNYNSDIGVPLSCFGVSRGHDAAVFEMGMNRIGEMAELVSIVKPSVAAITNIGTAHIGRIGSREGIAREKRIVFSHIAPNGRGFVRENEPFRETLVEGVEAYVQEFGPTKTRGVEVGDDLGLNGTELRFHGRTVRFPLPGAHNLSNALCAISMAQYLDVPEVSIPEALEASTTLFGRSQVLQGDVTIVLDCYNANSESMDTALDMLDSISSTGRKILIAGSMKELGESTEIEHERLGRRAAASSANIVYFFGEEAAASYRVANARDRRGNDEAAGRNAGRNAAGNVGNRAVAGAASEGSRAIAQDVRYFDNFDRLASDVAKTVTRGDIVLIKGSRSLELERLVSIIRPDLRVEE